MGAEAYRTIYEWFDIVWVFSLLFYIVFFFDGYPPSKLSILALLCVYVCVVKLYQHLLFERKFWS